MNIMLFRYEVNPIFIREFESHGFAFIGRDADQGNRMEIGELIRPLINQKASPRKADGDTVATNRQHPYFVGTQFHPEYTSRPMTPSPFFVGLLLSALSQRSRSDLQSTRSLASGLLLPTSKSWYSKQPASMPFNSLFPSVKKS